MKYVVVIFCLMIYMNADAHIDSSTYIITKKGDTVYLHTKAFMADHAHPQYIENRTAAGKKYTISADEIALLRFNNTPVVFGGLKGILNYSVIPILTKKGNTCNHFAYPLARQDSAVIYVSPYCNECNWLKLHYKTGDKPAGLLTNKNFRQVINTYFNKNDKLQAFAMRKRYNVNKLFKLLYQ